MKQAIALVFVLLSGITSAQFDGPADTPGSLAIYRDSSIITGWATSCTVVRGPQDISNASSPLADYGIESNAIGPATITDVVSLGDGGSATVTFAQPIQDVPGPDFAVFENSVIGGFLELAFVEVSSNGLDFYRFPATSNTPNDAQVGPFDTWIEAERLHNLAGKYLAGYGVPFDLAELDSITVLDISAITHVRIVDAVGSIDSSWGTYDRNGNPVNDPFPTAFPSGGFDLDGIAVLNPLSNIEMESLVPISFYPNPAMAGEWIHLQHSPDQLTIYDALGRTPTYECASGKIRIDSSGVFFARFQFGSRQSVQRIIVE